jgi:O-antigen/teichoic acid export membrane protein
MNGMPRSGLGGNAVAAVTGVGLEKLVALGVALYLPRHLGLEGYGHYALVVALLGFFQVLPDASLEAVLVARLARAGEAAEVLAGRGARVRLAVALAGGAAGLATLGAVTRDGGLVAAGAVAAAGQATAAGNPYRLLLRARLRLGRYLLLVGGQSVVAIVILAAVVRGGGGLAAVFAAVAAGAWGGVGLGRLLVGPGARLGADPGLGRRLLAEAWPLAANTLALIGAQQVLLPLLLLRFHGAAGVGVLAAAQKLVEAVGLLPQAFMVSVLPALAAAGAAPGGALGAAREAARVLMLVVVPVAAVLGFGAEPILGAVFGAPLAGAAPTLRALVPVALLAATGAVLTNLCVALGRQRALMRVTLVSAVVMVGLGAGLVPGFGPVGAALACGLAMAAGQAGLALLPGTREAAVAVLGATLRPVALGAAATALVVPVAGSPAAGALALVGLYLVAVVATRTVSAADLRRWAR